VKPDAAVFAERNVTDDGRIWSNEGALRDARRTAEMLIYLLGEVHLVRVAAAGAEARNEKSA